MGHSRQLVSRRHRSVPIFSQQTWLYWAPSNGNESHGKLIIWKVNIQREALASFQRQFCACERFRLDEVKDHAFSH